MNFSGNALSKFGYIYLRNKFPEKFEKCFCCNKNMKKHILLPCGCKFHGNCINFSKYCTYYGDKNNLKRKYKCPQCEAAANKIKRQFKESYTNPYYKMCQQRLIKEYNEICKDYNL